MQVTARGAYRMKGTSKTSGNAYDMFNLVIEKPQENVSRPNMQRDGMGLDQQDLELTPECFQKLKVAGLPWPCRLELVVGSRVGFRGLESVIEDFKLVGKPALAA